MRYLLIVVIFAVSFYSCNKNVKIIEEHDPIVKVLEEQDSMRIIKNDTIHKQTQKDH